MTNVITDPRSLHSFFRAAAVVMIGGTIGLGCQGQSDTSLRTRPEDLAEAPGEHVGQTVTISGEVDRVFSPRSFTVGGSDFARDLLILSTDSIAPVSGRTGDVPLAERDIVQVTGVVRRLNPTEFRKEFGVELPEQVASEFKNEPVVVALQSTAAMHGVTISPRLPAEDYGAVNELAMATDTTTQNALRGRVAALPSAPVQSVVRERMFWVGSGEDERVIVVANPESTPEMDRADAQPEVGEDWMLHGIFRELPAPGILRADWNLSDRMISQLKGHEVYLHALEAQPVTERDS